MNDLIHEVYTLNWNELFGIIFMIGCVIYLIKGWFIKND